MPYQKQSWVNGVSPVSASRLNHIEDGIAAALSQEDAAAYVIFRDTAGNPLPPGSVTEIRINTTTNEIDDIIFTPAED